MVWLVQNCRSNKAVPDPSPTHGPLITNPGSAPDTV